MSNFNSECFFFGVPTYSMGLLELFWCSSTNEKCKPSLAYFDMRSFQIKKTVFKVSIFFVIKGNLRILLKSRKLV